MLMALLLAESWAISNIGWQWDALPMFQPLDVAVACVGYAIWFETRKRWAGAFTLIAASQLGLHCIYEMEGSAFQIPYLFLLDLTFAAELVVVAWKGIEDVCADCVRWVRAVLATYRRLFEAKAVSHV
jgi:hypothetical protein